MEQTASLVDCVTSLGGSRKQTAGSIPSLPPIFCWTKMGVEAGQNLTTILRRKELERQIGDGVFVWGIGNSIKPTIRNPDDTIPVLFSPIISKPRAVDSNPAGVTIWQSYIDEYGKVRPLPRHSLVTSRCDDLRTGHQKRHYALLCRSKESLLQVDSSEVDFNELCNVGTEKGLGYSQVTALVRHVPRTACSSGESGRKYSVPFRADLFSPFCVRLANGVGMQSGIAAEIANVANAADKEEWASYVERLRCIAEERQLELAREADENRQGGVYLFGGASLAWA